MRREHGLVDHFDVACGEQPIRRDGAGKGLASPDRVSGISTTRSPNGAVLRGTRRSCSPPSRPARGSSVASSGSTTAATRPSRASMPCSQANSHSAAALEVARAPDDPAFVFDVPHMPLSLLDPSRDHRHRFETGSRHPPSKTPPGVGVLPDWDHEPAVRARTVTASGASPRARSRSPSRSGRQCGCGARRSAGAMPTPWRSLSSPSSASPATRSKTS